MSKGAKERSLNRYSALVEKIFFARYKKGDSSVAFIRSDLEIAAKDLGITLPKNLGDVLYSFRYRNELPKLVRATQPNGLEWIIEGVGRAKYAFRLSATNRISPNRNLLEIKIPDATPELIASYALGDEQALPAIVRYNRLVDIFLGVAAYSLQNHLRTTVKNMGQLEIDELYVGIDKRGCHYIVPMQAKGGNDHISVVQAKQDIRWCEQTFPGIRCRPVSAHFIASDLIALFELSIQGDEVRVVDEKHYLLVPGADVSISDKTAYAPE